MGKKVLFLLAGFGMITAGIAGITTSLVDQRNKVAVNQIERIKEEAQATAAEQQQKMEEQRQQMEKTAMALEEEKARLEEERQRTEAINRSREALLAAQKREASRPEVASPRKSAKNKPAETKKQQPTVLSKADPEARREKDSRSDSRQRLSARDPEQERLEHDSDWISRKASLQAARESGPVKFLNRKTSEVVLAEPYDAERGYVRVRVRIWRNDRLIKDTVVTVSQAALRTQSESRV